MFSILQNGLDVSSLYGRVYRYVEGVAYPDPGFLPIWEGVSEKFIICDDINEFPPYMGGCIVMWKG